MTYRPVPVPPGPAPVPAIAARLEPDAIGVTQDVVIGTANAAPAVAVALTLAPLAASRALIAAMVGGRHHRGRGGRDAGREVRPAFAVLPDPPRQRRQGAVMHAPSSPPGSAGRHAVTCQICGTPDPSPVSPCHQGHDHHVGWPAGCPACGRLKAVCAGWRACSVRRSSFAPLRLAVLRLKLAWRARRRPGPACCGTPGRCSRP